jgi:hypothetical protein
LYEKRVDVSGNERAGTPSIRVSKWGGSAESRIEMDSAESWEGKCHKGSFANSLDNTTSGIKVTWLSLKTFVFLGRYPLLLLNKAGLLAEAVSSIWTFPNSAAGYRAGRVEDKQAIVAHELS